MSENGNTVNDEDNDTEDYEDTDDDIENDTNGNEQVICLNPLIIINQSLSEDNLDRLYKKLKSHPRATSEMYAMFVLLVSYSDVNLSKYPFPLSLDIFIMKKYFTYCIYVKQLNFPYCVISYIPACYPTQTFENFKFKEPLSMSTDKIELKHLLKNENEHLYVYVQDLYQVVKILEILLEKNNDNDYSKEIQLIAHYLPVTALPEFIFNTYIMPAKEHDRVMISLWNHCEHYDKNRLMI